MTEYIEKLMHTQLFSPCKYVWKFCNRLESKYGGIQDSYLLRDKNPPDWVYRRVGITRIHNFQMVFGDRAGMVLRLWKQLVYGNGYTKSRILEFIRVFCSIMGYEQPVKIDVTAWAMYIRINKRTPQWEYIVDMLQMIVPINYNVVITNSITWKEFSQSNKLKWKDIMNKEITWGF
jgi:hypothetical protein